MRKYYAVLLIGVFSGSPTNADVWRWVDANGNYHYVDTMKPIYTWVDDFGKVYYADTPGHEDAVSVELVWHSSGTLADLEEDPSDSPGNDLADKERFERKATESDYCRRASEIYESYLKAPQLYRTDENGERVYLSEKEAKQTIEETREKRDALCK